MNTQDLKLLLRELHLLLQETEKFHDQTSVSGIFTDAKQRVFSLLGECELYAAAFVGSTNVGKSTLLNALFGANVTPRRNGPCTAVPIEFKYGTVLNICVYFWESLNRPMWSCRTLEEVYLRLNSLANDSGAKQSQMIKKIVVECPEPLLEGGIILGDTPGFGAAQLDEAEGSHDEAMKKYLESSVFRVYWIVRGEQGGILGTELKFYEECFQEHCRDIIVTGCEDWTEEDRAKFQKRTRPRLKDPMIKFHFVSGKNGLKALQNNDSKAYRESGIAALKESIRTDLLNEYQFEKIREQLNSLCEDILYWTNRHSKKYGPPPRGWWSPTSWAFWRANSGKCDLRSEITAKLSQIG